MIATKRYWYYQLILLYILVPSTYMYFYNKNPFLIEQMVQKLHEAILCLFHNMEKYIDPILEST